MKAPDFEYVRAPTLLAALKQLEAGDDVRLLAGGQSLLASLNLRLSQPQKLIDISHIKGLAGIRLGKGIVEIGAMTRHCDIETSSLIREKLPLLSMAAPYIAHPAIRNRGTFGGSIALADPAAEWPACCVALDATVVAVSRRGTRRIAAHDFFQGLYTTALETDEIITSVEIPIAQQGAVAGFSELARRHGDYALVGLAAQGTRSKDRWTDLKLVFFGVSDRPVLAVEAARALIGGAGIKAAQGCIDDALDFAGHDVCNAETRLHLARVLLGRVISTMEGNSP
ncbi:MAG: FAD binding domain-containing protein [Beijerinckiaceae bacterium]